MEPDEKLIKQMVIASVGKCMACGSPYEPDSITILGHQDRIWFLMIVCEQCNSHGLVAAVLKDTQVSRLSDLTPAEAAKFEDARPITSDDVLEMHEFLEEFDGDFAKLFGNPQKPRNW